MRTMFFVLLSAALLTPPVYSQHSNRPLSETRSISAQELDAPPTIDGILNDECWQNARWQGNFIQLKPSLGGQARAGTFIAVNYDRKNLYVAFRCINPAGNTTNSTIIRRDSNFDLDNAVTLYLDTFHNRRDCYYFSTNSKGTQVDGRIGENGRSNDKSWDCTWQTESHEDSTEWSAEMAIPFSEIRISRDESQIWGVNFKRNYPEYLEMSFWNASDRVWQVSRFGDLTGIKKPGSSTGIKLFPYLINYNSNTGASQRRHIYSSGDTEVITGGDLRFSMGATATGNITYNPDFATIEADQEVINLTRYETFYPEKRLYFLEGAELFQNRIQVFYSRRIGDIDYGLKSSGRAGAMNYAVLTAQDRPSNGDRESRTSVARLQRDILGSSNIGFTLIDRNFSGGYNRVFSTDATVYLPSHVRITSQFVGSIPSEGNYTKAYFVRAARDEERYHYHLRFTNIDPGFQKNVNEVGFIPDDNRHELDSDINYRWWLRNGTIERITFSSLNNIFWSHRGTMRSARLTQFAGITFKNKWNIGFSNNYHTEQFEKRFYNHTILPEIGYNEDQWYSYSLGYQHGRNFDSDLRMWTLRGRMNPADRFSIEYRFRHLKLNPDPSGRSTVQHVFTGDYNFTRDLYLRLFTQLNSSNNRFYIYGLFGWRFKPPFGALYIAYTADYFDDIVLYPSMPRERQRTFFVKLTTPVSL